MLIRVFFCEIRVPFTIKIMSETAKDKLKKMIAWNTEPALTDAEVATLAGQVERLPAGAQSVAISLVIALALFLWWTKPH